MLRCFIFILPMGIRADYPGSWKDRWLWGSLFLKKFASVAEKVWRVARATGARRWARFFRSRSSRHPFQQGDGTADCLHGSDIIHTGDRIFGFAYSCVVPTQVVLRMRPSTFRLNYAGKGVVRHPFPHPICISMTNDKCVGDSRLRLPSYNDFEV